MMFDVLVTPRRFVAFAGVVFVVLCLLISPFLNDLQIDDESIRSNRRIPLSRISFAAGTNGSSSSVPSSSDEEDPGSAERRRRLRWAKGPVPDDALKHIHWFVQVSDVHLSLFYDEKRETDLLHFCQENLEIIKPEVVLVTGDITDAKFADKEGSMQFVNEWKQYDRILRESEILEKTVWLDTRGNHDAFDVPSLTSNKNYFRMFSARGKQHSLSYRYHHRTNDGDSFSFISIDACPNPGPKRPFNFFGLIGESEFNNLKNLAEESVDSNHTIFFGHYPTSTIGSPHPGIRQLLSHGAVYLCGHLHTMAGMVPNMYALQQLGYLELELADWKDSRFYRLFAIDHDLISLIDVNFEQWPVILVTNPKNALFHVPGQEPTQRIGKSTHIRLLIFSKGLIKGVSVEVDGASVGRVKHAGGPLYVVPWQPTLYSQGLHVIRVSAEDSLGFQNKISHYFSIDGSRPSFGFTSRFFLMSDHTKLVRSFTLPNALVV